MAEVSQQMFLGTDQVFGFYNDSWTGINPYSSAAPSSSIQFRTDPYSASLFLAVPGSQFSSLGMTSPLQDVSSLIRGTGSNISLISTGSGQLYASSSVLNYSGSNWATEGYTTATVTANQKNLGALPWNQMTGSNGIGMGNQDFVVEMFLAPVAPNWGAGPSAPFQLHILGTNSGDSLTLQWSFGTTVRFYMDASALNFTLNSTLGNYYYFAFVRSGTNKYIYINGTRVASGTFSGDFDSEEYCSILGFVNANDAVGKLVQDFRVYIGTDKGYTGATITVPSSIVQTIVT
jgi:hypothetical protein